MKLSAQQVARAGEHLVAAEINLRGGYAAMITGNMPEIGLLAANAARTRTIGVQVITRSSGSDWQVKTTDGRLRESVGDDSVYWVFVDLSTREFWVAPGSWIQNVIELRDMAYLERHGGQRPLTPSSDHTTLPTEVLEEWKNGWDVLGILQSAPELTVVSGS
jgi:hypothetical protein